MMTVCYKQSVLVKKVICCLSKLFVNPEKWKMRSDVNHFHLCRSALMRSVS